jgi:hypothetical protein
MDVTMDIRLPALRAGFSLKITSGIKPEAFKSNIPGYTRGRCEK